MITMDSKIRDVYNNPIGHDIIYKILLQLGIDEKMITNPIVGNMKLKSLSKIGRASCRERV